MQAFLQLLWYSKFCYALHLGGVVYVKARLSTESPVPANEVLFDVKGDICMSNKLDIFFKA